MIPDGTELLEAEDEHGTVYLTLSEEFQFDDPYREELARNQIKESLMLYSDIDEVIIN